MTFSIFHSSRELIKLLYSLTSCNLDADCNSRAQDVYGGLWRSASPPFSLLHGGRTALRSLAIEGASGHDPTEVASILGRDVPDGWAGGGRGSDVERLDR